MKVLHVEAGKHLYGGALQVVFLLEALRRPGDEHVLACPRGAAIADAARPHAARVHEIEMKGDADIGMVGRLRQLIRAERPDVVHLHSRRGSDLWGGIAARLEGVPVVLSRRVDNPEPRWWVGLKYRLYDRVIAISEGIRQVLLSEGLAADKVVCVHSAVDTQRYRPGCDDVEWFRAEFGIAEGELTVGMAAQFIPRKGHRMLLEALPAVLAVHPNTHVLLFGQGPEQEPVKRLIQAAGLENRVHVEGFRRDLDRVLPCLDVLAHPAEMEGLGVALLQAAACAVPIVACRAGGIPEVVRHGLNGELVAPGDAPALSEALTKLLSSSSLRRAYGDAGRTLVLERFSIGAMAAGNHAVYTTVRKAA
ncbi:glycosyltransferase [Caldimonas brevitalea]|uniref:Glycosyl transferase n=1 Tax=Caldimonas brevitalea TaxID=413882 RepID=A0A0G3BMJ0_9BURK|nr:glycosyltransferase [Caldimonas brevitalea]AKJ30627.1 glycosyl transferase [Caldimonas brevitalea]